MQFPESWLREYCNPPLTTQALADALTMAGLEVEELDPVAPPFTGIVVGEIIAAEQHPNADRLRVCQVNVGEAAPLSIVCGAPNARVGIKVPCAMVGAELPPGEDGKPFKIKVGKLRGVESFGMLCSARELGISDESGGLLELPADAPLGQNIRAYLNLDDTLFTLKLTPNLAHCLSVYGVAREVSAITGSPLKPLPAAPVVPAIDTTLPVRISAPDLCGRFSGRVVKGVNTQVQTPAWMQARLLRCGQRPVSPLVDISNYVMFERGRPSHIFDLDKIQGGLDVRWGRAGESLKLLNGNTVSLDEQVGVIADAQAVESLAGIMGGDATAVSDSTRDIYIEAAFWWPEAIAGRSRRFNFSTDAGHRFERGVDPEGTVDDIEYITALVQQVCGGQAGPVTDDRANMPVSKAVRMRVERCAKILGMPLTQQQCVDALTRLGLPVTEEPGVITVQAPSRRFDIQIEEDLIEEVARIVGYDNLPDTPPLAPVVPSVRSESRKGRFALRHQLADRGYLETVNFSFVPADWERDLAGNANPINLLNPIVSQMSVMRSSLIGSLLQVLKFNVDRRADRVRVFEVGRVFWRDAAVQTTDQTVAGVNQPMHVAGLAYGQVEPLAWNGKQPQVDFYDVKADVEALLAPRQAVFAAAQHPAMHPGRCASVSVDGQVIGHVGELHPKWRQQWELAHAPVVFELALDAVLPTPLPKAQPLPKQLPVERDLALIVPESVTHQQLMDAVHAADTQHLLQSATLFDVYRPKAGQAGGLAEGEKSLAVRFMLNKPELALTEAEIEAAMQAVADSVTARVGGRLRG